MSEQDGTDADAAAVNGESDTESPAASSGEESTDTSEEAEESAAGLDDIAEEPEDDADDVLADIAAEVHPDGEGADHVVEADPDEELVDHVNESDPETVAAELATLRDRVTDLESELDEREREVEDLESRLARKQADFQNYKKRQKERLEEEKERATEDLVSRLLEVRDSLRRALDQDDDADIRGGVESTVRQFDEQLRRENVEPIEPEPGDETDPTRHEVLMGVESDQPEGTVVDVHRPGYEMAGKVLREAQVTVSEGSPEE